jgi:hypothetical protein
MEQQEDLVVVEIQEIFLEVLQLDPQEQQIPAVVVEQVMTQEVLVEVALV